jgi:hypothetical protein
VDENILSFFFPAYWLMIWLHLRGSFPSLYKDTRELGSVEIL